MDLPRSVRGWFGGRVPAAAVAIILAAAALRLYDLSAQPFWYDELISMSLGLFRGGLEAIWTVKDYPHPSLYPSMLYFLLRVFPPEEFPVRLLSAVAGILAFPILYRFVTDTASRGIALAAMLLLAFSPFHIYFSQEGRPYALMFTLALFTVWVFYKALQTNRAGWWVTHFFCLLVLLYMHYFNWSLVGSEVLFVLFFWRRYKSRLVPFGLSLLAAPLSLPALLPLIRGSLSAGQIMVLNLVPVSISFPDTWKTLVAGETRYVGQGLRLAGVLAFGLRAVVGSVRLARYRPRLLVLILCLLAVPFVFVFVVLKALDHVVPPYEDKMFIIALPFALILAAAGIEFLLSMPGSQAVRRVGRVVAVLSLTVLLGSNLAALQRYYTGFVKNADVRVIDYLESRVEAGDIVISDGFSMAMNLKYHWDSQTRPDMVAWPLYTEGGWQFSSDLSALPESPIKRDVSLVDALTFSRVWLVAQGNFGASQLADDILEIQPAESSEQLGPFTVYLFVP